MMSVKDRMAQKQALLDSLTKTGRAYLVARQDNFSKSLMTQLESRGTLSPKQVDALERVATQRVEEKSFWNGVMPITEGRRQVSGIVVSAKWRDYGNGSRATWVVATPEGKVWGTIPVRIVRDCPMDAYGTRLIENLVGAEVTFEATVERSKDDPHFGILRRPA